jgi:hypothetical protein
MAPLVDQIWLKSTPSVHLPGCVSATAEGPTPNFSLPRELLVATGSRTTGPAPQMMRPDAAGEKKAVATMSPSPLMRRPSGPGCDASGMITRRITFVLLETPNGITGWMFSSVPVASRSPSPKSQLPCSGTLIRLATGFCVCFASSSAS